MIKVLFYYFETMLEVLNLNFQLLNIFYSFSQFCIMKCIISCIHSWRLFFSILHKAFATKDEKA